MQTQSEYARIIEQLNFLDHTTQPDIAYAVHQCVRFTSDPRESHKQSVLRIGRYLMATKDEGIILSIRKSQNMELWCDADFCGNLRGNGAHGQVNSKIKERVCDNVCRVSGYLGLKNANRSGI